MVTKKANSILVGLTLLLTSFGWPTTVASSPEPMPAPSPATATQKKSSASKKKTTRKKAPRRRSRRSSRTRRQLAITRSLQQQTQAAIARDDLQGEDMEIRQAAITALGDNAGTVVVMDPQTGRVYSIVNQDWAVREGFVPCSTIKPYVALAGIKEELIKPTFQMEMVGSPLSLSLIDALSRSDNGYFQQVGQGLGWARLRQYTSAFGLGQTTGINLPGEVAGRIPDGQKGSNVSLASSHGTGFEVTPLQLAVFTAAIANQGAMYKPQVIAPQMDGQPLGYSEGNGGGDLDRDVPTDAFTPIVIRELDLDPVERINLIAGMTGAVEFGTARGSYDPTILVAGKTGTCTGSKGVRIGLFSSFATIDQPRLVVVVITQGIHERGSLAAQIAGRVYQQLADRFQLRSTKVQLSRSD